VLLALVLRNVFLCDADGSRFLEAGIVDGDLHKAVPNAIWYFFLDGGMFAGGGMVMIFFCYARLHRVDLTIAGRTLLFAYPLFIFAVIVFSPNRSMQQIFAVVSTLCFVVLLAWCVKRTGGRRRKLSIAIVYYCCVYTVGYFGSKFVSVFLFAAYKRGIAHLNETLVLMRVTICILLRISLVSSMDAVFVPSN